MRPDNRLMDDTIAVAHAAVANGDWSAASRSWRSVLAARPDLEEAYAGAGLALRRHGQPNEAERILTEGMARFPGASRLAVEHGWTAYDRHDWTEMARRFEHVRDRFPDDPSGYVGLGAALREQGRPADADTVLSAGIARFPDRLDLLINHAWSGHRAGDWPEALRRWAVVTTSHPDDPSGYGGTAVTARQAGRPDLEDAVLLVACERFPTIVQFAERHAEAAAALADWPAAIRRWQSARERFPAHESCHVGLAHALLAAMRADEAETVFGQAVERFPRNLEIATEYARMAGDRHDWTRALPRWETVRERFPDTASGYVGVGLSLRLIRRFEDAEAALVLATGRFPDSLEAALEHAWVAKSQRDWPEALRRLWEIQARFPRHPAVWAGIGEVLRERGELDAAEATLGEAMRQFPDDQGILFGHAQVAAAREEWDQAVARWQALKEKYPHNIDVQIRLGDAIQMAALASASGGDQTIADHDIRHEHDAKPSPQDDASRFFFEFESLGDNCEFGVVQRHFGAEPLSLLRFAGITPEMLASGLKDGFSGIWEPENVVLSLEGDEYFVDDKKYGTRMHTFIRSDTTDAARFHSQMCKRLRFLANKLVGDLRTGEKIFVYKTRDGVLSDDAMWGIFDSIRLLGNSPFLCVRSGADNTSGETQLLAPGFALGHISKLSPIAFHEDILYDEWEKICRGAYRLLRPGEDTIEPRGKASMGAGQWRKQQPVNRLMDDTIVAARAAVANGDWPAASRSWQSVLAARPDLEEAYAGAGLALRRHGQLDEAERILTEGMARFPGAARLAVEHGWTAYDRRDWTEMARRFEHVRDRFPDDPSGYVGLGAALREQGRPADADTVFAAGIARFPDRLDLLINHAWSGHRAGDWPEALRRWAVVTTSHPDDPSGYGGTAVTARQAGRPDLEDAVLLAACERFPTIVQFAERHAEAAAALADWPAAIRRWQSALDRFPAHENSHVGLARALMAATRADDAETVLGQAVELFPRNLEIATQYARMAGDRHDWARALARWEKVRERFPDTPSGYVGVGLSLRLIRRFEDAETALTLATARFPDSLEAALEHAWVAKSQRDWPEALRRLWEIQARFPRHPAVWAGIGEVLRERGELDAAEATLGEAMRQFPDDQGIAIQHALVANGRRDWNTAIALWRRLSSRFPGDPRILEGFGQAQWGAQLDAEVPPSEEVLRTHEEIASRAVVTPGPAFVSGNQGGIDLAALFMQFESLGDNCEFGLLQRHFGAEPLGLLRWTGTPPSRVTAALTNRFEGVGDPENTILEAIRGEYVTRDRRYGMVMHTFVSEQQTNKTRLFAQQCKRLKFLRDKLVGDLVSGEKIFVCRSVDELTDVAVTDLFRAVKTYGNSNLVCVRPGGQDGLPGTVRMVEPGLFVGSIDRLGPQRGPAGDTWDISFDMWQKLCQRVLELTRA